MLQVDFRQTPTFDLAPQITNKQYTSFVFPPPPPSSTTTQCRHVTTRCQQPPTPSRTADCSQPTPTRTTTRTTRTTWQRQATNPSSTRPRSTTTPPTRAPRHRRQRLKGDGVCRRRRGNVPRRPDSDDACHRHRLHLQVSPYIPLPLFLSHRMQGPHRRGCTSTSTIAATTTIISMSTTTDRLHTKTTAHKRKRPPGQLSAYEDDRPRTVSNPSLLPPPSLHHTTPSPLPHSPCFRTGQ